jgi:hypothetical protein
MLLGGGAETVFEPCSSGTVAARWRAGPDAEGLSVGRVDANSVDPSPLGSRSRMEARDEACEAAGRGGGDDGGTGRNDDADEDKLGGGAESGGDGWLWMTLNKSWSVRIAAFRMGSTWCARFGRMAGMRRGVKGTMVSWAKSRNSAIQRRAVDRWISSSTRRVSVDSKGRDTEEVRLTLRIQLRD